jgi:acetyl-CoA carboxylase alpha subunit
MKTWVGPIVTLLIALATIAVTYGQTKEKVMNIEERQKEDRRNTRENISEVREHVKQIDKATQEILQTLKAMEAVQRAERRERSK